MLQKKIRPGALLSGSGTLLFSGKGRRKFSATTRGHETILEDFLPADIVSSVERGDWSGWQIAVDSRGRIRWEKREKTFWGKNWHPLVLVANITPPAYISQLRRKHIPYIVAGTRRVDLWQAMKKLHDELGLRCVASLGGGRLNGALLRAGLVDEVSVVLIPMVVGGERTPTSFDAVELGSNEMPLVLNLVDSKIQKDGSIWLRYLA